MFNLKKKEDVFYDLFDGTMEKALEAANALVDLLEDYTDVETKIAHLKDIEHECDLHVHKVLKALNASFVTPIDREDIYMVAKEMDNIVDTIEEVANRFVLFHVTTIREEAKVMSKLIVECVFELKCLVNELRVMKRSKILKDKIIEVNRIENVGDVVYRNAIKGLFEKETNAIELIKWKQIYELMENSLDSCEDVANIIEGVIMKHA
jgi:predicted phosphate transport protein (TIGR00153 family)